MQKLFGALAAALLAFVLLAPPAQAHCWQKGHRYDCGHVRHHHHVKAYQPYSSAPFYYRPGYYPYAYYPAPANYQPNYSACFPLWPFFCL